MAPHLDKQLGYVQLAKMHLHSLLSLTSDSKSKDSIMHEGDFITSHLYSSTGLWPKDAYTCTCSILHLGMEREDQCGIHAHLHTVNVILYTISNNIKRTNEYKYWSSCYNTMFCWEILQSWHLFGCRLTPSQTKNCSSPQNLLRNVHYSSVLKA